MVDPIKSARSRNARKKGHGLERWVANSLKPLYPDAHRQPQSQLTLLRKIVETTGIPMCFTDVVAGPYGIECKNRKVLPTLQSTLDQATQDVGQSGKIPLALHKGGKLGRGKVICGYRSAITGELMEIEWSLALEAMRRSDLKGHFPLAQPGNVSCQITYT